ncbi:MAG: hypothetical protein K9K66_01835 [Desulfarculaceae bacterium]|nr:hypothetical protein [Desulfarculaceae bacterium]MCF8073477.1 hypothetical protein [Desulfarculaceae bacterium]MCF8100376.1 hypothetical protein [Desulfarculaceae bacterium]MCF8115888.1 hypothetical protein [Desulfarculaceae bacterium]
MLKTTRLLLLCALFVGLTACAVGGSSARLARVEMAPGFHAAPLHRVMVVGAIEEKNKRINFENEFARQFRAHGATAFTSLAVLPEGKERDRDEILRQAKAQKAQAIFVGYLITVDRKGSATPTFNQDFYSIAPGFNAASSRPTSYSQEKVKVRILTQLYDVKTGKPFWTAETQVINPEYTGEVLAHLAKVVMPELQAKGLVK